MGGYCTHHAPDSCRDCDGTSSEEIEYSRANREQKRAYDHAMATWWLARNPIDTGDAA